MREALRYRMQQHGAAMSCSLYGQPPADKDILYCFNIIEKDEENITSTKFFYILENEIDKFLEEYELVKIFPNRMPTFQKKNKITK